MIEWVRHHRRSATLVGLTLLVPLFIYLSTLFSVIGLGLEYRGEKNRLEPRLARLEGLVVKEAELSERSQQATEAMRSVVYADGQDSSALAASLQAEVRQLFSEAGLSVSNSQVLPVRQGERFDRVAVKLTVSGSLPALDAAMIGIAAYQPRLLVESVDAFPARTGGRPRGEPPPQMLTAVIQVMALRALQ